ncbi:MAG: FAD-binding oxidoreductase [Chloroflexota bacterium]|nr:FAD-binding oxidoreductase [Dehalococcoidia bacterium]MDW8253618.1 FAD-binding oxidoreductase [Chloroflexota bacterium]
MSATETLARELRPRLPTGRVLTDPAQLDSFSYDASFFSFLHPHPPDVVVQAYTRDDVVAVLQVAHRLEVPVTPRGAATGQTGGAVPVRGGIVLDLSQMKRVVELDQANLQVFVEPGVIHADLNALLARQRLMFPPDPGSSRMCSIGGVVSNNARGMRAMKYGATSEWVLGLEVVLADGTVIWTGSPGSRALQSASGYELSKLFCGAEGTLGVITQLRLRVRPQPEARGLTLAAFPRLEETATALSAVFDAGILPSAVEIFDERMIQTANRYRPDLGLPAAAALLLFEVDGNPPGVRYDAARVAEIVRPWASHIEWADAPDRVAQIWEARSVAGAAVGLLQQRGVRAYAGEDICVPIARLGEALERIQAISSAYGLPIASYGHIGGGIVHAALVADLTDVDQVRRVELAADAINRLALELNGTVTGEHGVGCVRARYLPQEHGPALEVMRAIKRALDPKGILNPGKFV